MSDSIRAEYDECVPEDPGEKRWSTSTDSGLEGQMATQGLKTIDGLASDASNPTGLQVETTTSNDVANGYERLKAVAARIREPKRRPQAAPIEVEVLQRFIGVVRAVRQSEKQFDADLYDLTDRSRPPEGVCVGFDEIAEADINLVREGAVLYWTIGRQRIRTETRRFSLIKFRRLPVWRDGDVRATMEKAAELETWIESVERDGR